MKVQEEALPGPGPPSELVTSPMYFLRTCLFYDEMHQ